MGIFYYIISITIFLLCCFILFKIIQHTRKDILSREFVFIEEDLKFITLYDFKKREHAKRKKKMKTDIHNIFKKIGTYD